ncbi:MAG: UMP kinase [Legionellales bacterium]|nr:UMP kinase [Legionellales bacterium]
MPKSEHKGKYQRVLLKLSGEALMGDRSFGIDPLVLDRIARDVRAAIESGVQVGMVIGGGNLFRGANLSKAGIGRVSADQMGMLATVMNAIAMRDALERVGQDARILSAVAMNGVVEIHDRRHAIRQLEKNVVVIFSAGTGNPFVTTDSAASLRAIECDADVLLKATQVEGVYDADPSINPDAKLYKQLTFSEVLEKELGVMDLGAFCQCRDHDMPIRVFNLGKSGAFSRAIAGEEEGTLVTN